MDRASRETEIFSSEVLIQSNMPLQPFRGNVKLELVVVGRLWMLMTEEHKERAHSEPSYAKDTFLSCDWPNVTFTQQYQCDFTGSVDV